MPTAAGYSPFLTARKPDTMDFFQLRRLFVELQCLGVTLPDGHTGRSGGAGPAEGRTVIIEGRHLNVPTESWYVSFSPYSIEHSGDCWLLYKEKHPTVCRYFSAGARLLQPDNFGWTSAATAWSAARKRLFCFDRTSGLPVLEYTSAVPVLRHRPVATE